MENIEIEQQKAVCWNCGIGISVQDRYCRHCGKGQGAFAPWYYKPWGIIAATMFALGPFSLFLVWRSPVISKKSKFIYSAAILLISWYVGSKIYGMWLMFQSLLGGFTSRQVY